ncbi:MAG: sugar phosphate isomerase/epimerase [Candidatus Hadarchaeota archaeon]
MKIGLSTLLFVKSSVEDSVRMIAELGADCVEVIYDVPHFMHDHDPRQLGGLKELVNSYGLEPSVHSCFWDLNPASHYPEVEEFALKRVKRSIEACERLGGRVVVVHPGRAAIPELEWFMETARKKCMKFFDECAAFARDRGVKVAIENIGLPFFVCSSPEELGDIVDGRDGLGITLDIGHAYRRIKSAGVQNPEEKVAEIIARLRNKITHIHFHDNHGESDEHLIPGEGSIDFRPIVGAIKGINYKGLVVVELFDPGNPGEAGRKGLEKTKKLLGPQ